MTLGSEVRLKARPSDGPAELCGRSAFAEEGLGSSTDWGAVSST